MNKELIKQYKAEFDHWLNGGELLFKPTDKQIWFNTATLSPIDWEVDGVYIINDEYVEFRIALAEGKTIQVIASEDVWVDFEIGTLFYQIPENYCIKPEFTYPMWFKSTRSDLIVKFIEMNNGEILNGDEEWKRGEILDILMAHTNTDVWTQVSEPKKILKMAKYRFFNGIRYVDTQAFYTDNIDFKEDYNYDKISNITRLLETEIEVEDY